MCAMTMSARTVAEEIRRRLPGVGNVKLHKLLYYAQGHHLATFGEPLFGESISAWDMGPVVGSLWHRDRTDPTEPLPTEDLGEAELNTVAYTLSRYGGMTGRDLIRLSHGEEPWMRADQGRHPGTSVRIPVDSMRDYFVSVSHDDEDDGWLLDEVLLRELLEGAASRRERPAKQDDLEDLLARRHAR